MALLLLAGSVTMGYWRVVLAPLDHCSTLLVLLSDRVGETELAAARLL
jgi:hypothetical protein